MTEKIPNDLEEGDVIKVCGKWETVTDVSVGRDGYIFNIRTEEFSLSYSAKPSKTFKCKEEEK